MYQATEHCRSHQSGRPRKAGHTAGTPEGKRSKQGSSALITLGPRLFDLAATAAYLGVSPWTVRDLEWKGVLRRVRVPLPGGQELRKLLFDKADLDRLIEGWKEAA